MFYLGFTQHYWYKSVPWVTDVVTILSQLPQLTHLPFPRRSLTILVPNSSLGSDWCRDIYARLPLPQNFHFCEFVDFNSWIIWLRVVVALSEISLSLSE